MNGILCWREAHPDSGAPMIVTHSSGNHGQAVAWAARQTGSPCTVVVPEGTPHVKVRVQNIYVGQGVLIKADSNFQRSSHVYLDLVLGLSQVHRCS